MNESENMRLPSCNNYNQNNDSTKYSRRPHAKSNVNFMLNAQNCAHHSIDLKSSPILLSHFLYDCLSQTQFTYSIQQFVDTFGQCSCALIYHLVLYAISKVTRNLNLRSINLYHLSQNINFHFFPFFSALFVEKNFFRKKKFSFQ